MQKSLIPAHKFDLTRDQLRLAVVAALSGETINAIAGSMRKDADLITNALRFCGHWKVASARYWFETTNSLNLTIDRAQLEATKAKPFGGIKHSPNVWRGNSVEHEGFSA